VSRPKRWWILALPLIGASLVLSGSAAARESADATAETVSAHRSAAQKPAKAQEHHPRRHFAHHVRSPAPDPDEKAPPAPARPSAINRGELAPRPAPTVRIQTPLEVSAAPHAAPAPAVSAETPAAPTSIGQHVDPVAARIDVPVATEGTEQAVTSPAADDTARSQPSMAIKVLALFAVCAGAAVGCYRLLTPEMRHQAGSSGLASPRRNPAGRPLPKRDDRPGDRVAQQRLFPHQFGAAIRG
jgi:hypothetical protein